MRISVIIPTLNEGERIASLIVALREEDAPVEVIVVDGGSGDGTIAEARAAGARVLSARAGRGSQLAKGAEAATGEVLWFLHADCRPGVVALTAIRRVFADLLLPGAAAAEPIKKRPDG